MKLLPSLKVYDAPSPIWHEGKLILSCSDAIGTALSRHTGAVNGKVTTEIPVFSQGCGRGQTDCGSRSKKEKARRNVGSLPGLRRYPRTFRGLSDVQKLRFLEVRVGIAQRLLR